MNLINKILLANDFSTSAEDVVSTAIALAKIFHSEVVPIHVLPGDMVNKKVQSLLHEAASQKLQDTVDKLSDAGIKTGNPILSSGSPHKAIVRAAIDRNANMILAGSGEVPKNGKVYLGTTTERIIIKSDKPVFVVKEGTALNVQHILCPIDFSLTSRRALKNAITMAHRFKAQLTILSVCELQGSSWFTAERDKALENDSRCHGHEKKFNKFISDFNLAGLKCNTETRKGNPAEEILNLIDEKNIDLLIMGTTGKTGLSRLIIGSVTEKVIREVPCSFITIKSKDIINLELQNDIQDIENHYKIGMQLLEDGFFEESIEQFKLCLSINNMHVPSHFGIAKVYERMEDTQKAKVYKKSGREILNRIWDKKIEEEVRKLRGQ